MIGADRVQGLRQVGPLGKLLAPCVAKPESGQERELGCVGSAIQDGDADEDVVNVVLGVFGEDVEVAIFIEDAGVFELVLGIEARAAGGLGDERIVGKG